MIFKSRARFVSWGFGGLNDRGATHAMSSGTGAAFALTSIPLIGLELDLLAGGESDAEALGANTARVKTIALATIALSTATAVAVCGQIAFVGLLVPHLVRKLAGPRHRALLLLSFLTGATLLLLVVLVQDGLLPALERSLKGTEHTTSRRSLAPVGASARCDDLSVRRAVFYSSVETQQAELVKSNRSPHPAQECLRRRQTQAQPFGLQHPGPGRTIQLLLQTPLIHRPIAIINFQAQAGQGRLAYASPFGRVRSNRVPASVVVASFVLIDDQGCFQRLVPALPDFAALLKGAQRCENTIIEINASTLFSPRGQAAFGDQAVELGCKPSI